MIKFKILARDLTCIIPMQRLDSTADMKCELLVRQKVARVEKL